MKKTINILIILPSFCQIVLGQGKTHKIDSLLTVFHKNNELNGAVLVAENGRQIFKNVYGYSDFDNKIKLDTNSIFNIASVSKPLTAMAIMILHDRGNLNIDSTASSYLLNFPYKEITLRQLLNHTSGLPDFVNEFDQFSNLIDTSEAFDNSDLFKLLAEHEPELNFEPGEKYSYSNTGYNLLAILVEKVSEKSFGEFMQNEIFNPLGMRDSYISSSFKNMGKIAKGYRFRDGAYIEDSLGVYIKSLKASSFKFDTQGSGNILSTVADLYKFDQALRNGKLIKPETLNQAFTKAILNNNKEIPYGFGWRIFENLSMKSVYHGGSAIGYRAFFRRGIKADNNTIIILSNTSNMNPFTILNGINAILNE